MMGGEPTFISIDDFDSPQWTIAALGNEKFEIAQQLLQKLQHRFNHPGSILLHSIGKSYPGESIPRWALGCYWREDHRPIWHNPILLAHHNAPLPPCTDPKSFLLHLTQLLHLNPAHIRPAYEPQPETDSPSPAGYLLPILPIDRPDSDNPSPTAEPIWTSCAWELPTPFLELLPGSATIGLRLPLHQLPKDHLLTEAQPTLQPNETITLPPLTPPHPIPPNTIHLALTAETRNGILHLFLPPLSTAKSFLVLVHAIETTAAHLQIPIQLEGYAPPSNQGIQGFQITPDPGVIEVNIHPAQTWEELVHINQTVYETAADGRLGTCKQDWDKHPISTGGGAHITIGGHRPATSPLLRRPDLLRSLITYWQHHPSLTYLFSDQFIGSTSQAPRIDEGRPDNLAELEIALHHLQPSLDPAVMDHLLSHLLTDLTGNTHRAELCIDKLFPIANPRSQFGILEFRSIAMPQHHQLRSLQMLLIRACIVWFWEQPYTAPLISWGHQLHDRFLLPHFLEQDLDHILRDLQQAGFPFDRVWFQPFFQFRFPHYATFTTTAGQSETSTQPQRLNLEFRRAIEPWKVLGDASGGGTSRPVDISLERLQIKLTSPDPIDPDRYHLHCNHHALPFQSADTHTLIAAVRFRARKNTWLDHPAVSSHTPLQFALIDTHTQQSIGHYRYHITPDGIQIHPTEPHSHHPHFTHPKIHINHTITLDLRRTIH